jgi:peptide/nickel transport system permease protein
VSATSDAVGTAPVAAAWRQARTRRRALPVSMWIGLLMVGLVAAVGFFAPVLTPFDPVKTDLANSLDPPSSTHLLGTDNFGRDIFTRLIYGARVDLQIGLVPTLIMCVIGLVVGTVAAYGGGAIDGLLMRIVDVSMAFPFYVLVIAIVAMLGPGLGNMYVAMVLAGWVAYARIIRGEVLVAKNYEYIHAARALGATDRRVICAHVLPNVVTVAIIFAMSDVVLNILLGGALSFLGLGVQPPTPEWGLMIAEGRDFLLTFPAMVIFPGLALLWVGVAFNLLGDGLADRLRPRE